MVNFRQAWKECLRGALTVCCWKLQIFRFSVWVNRPTPGQALLNLRYRDERSVVPSSSQQPSLGSSGAASSSVRTPSGPQVGHRSWAHVFALTHIRVDALPAMPLTMGCAHALQMWLSPRVCSSLPCLPLSFGTEEGYPTIGAERFCRS